MVDFSFFYPKVDLYEETPKQFFFLKENDGGPSQQPMHGKEPRQEECTTKSKWLKKGIE